MKEIAIGFVIYKPEPDFWQRIEMLNENGYKCFIFDNHPNSINFSIKNYELEYTTVGKNLGLGIGISCVCAQAFYKGYKSLFFFDQDTIFNMNCIDFVNEFNSKYNYYSKDYSSFVFNSKKLNQVPNVGKYFIKETYLSISSGSLFFLNRLKELNWHDHTFFIDCVDYEFCYNSYRNNLKIGECLNTPGFDHVTGQEDKQYKLFHKVFKTRKYPLFRIKDTIYGSLKILNRTIKDANFKFGYLIIRSLLIYLYFQLLSRLLKPLSSN